MALWDELRDDHRPSVINNDAFFVIEPSVRAEINILRFMRLNAGVSYRYTDNLQLVNTSTDMINNFTAMVGLKFGKFE
jgi:hypothetical protein